MLRSPAAWPSSRPAQVSSPGAIVLRAQPRFVGEAVRPLERRPGAGADRGQAALGLVGGDLVEATVCLGRSARDGVQSMG